MLDYIFAGGNNWSWTTFLLYYSISIIVVNLCRAGSQYDRKLSGVGSESIKWTRRGSFYYFLAFLILLVLATIRNNYVGSDTYGYVEDFKNASFDGFSFDLVSLMGFYQEEPGYTLFTSCVRSISSDYHFLYLCLYFPLSLAYICFIRYFLEKEINTGFLKLFIVFFVANMSGMRSALALTPLLFSFIALHKRKFFLASFLTLLAVTCHYTMLFNFFVIIGCYIFNKFPSLFKVKFLVAIVMISIVIAVSGSTMLFSIFEETKYSFYTERQSDLTFAGSLFYIAFGVFLFLSLNEKGKSSKLDTLMKVSSLFILIYPIVFITGAYRIPNYYALPRLIVWGYMTNLFIKRTKLVRIGSLAAEAIVFVYMLYRFYQSSLDGHFMYQI